ncbi:MAG: flavodoxin family protein [Spirochaetaceae bacterium]|nr:MAG: flavodoxin family protein [Spirochaetaceae bacterium]
MKATVVYFSVSGKNEQVAKAIDRELKEKGHTTDVVYLQPKRPMGVIKAVINSVFSRSVELAEQYSAGDAELLVLVGPVWASSVNPVTRAFLAQLTDLGGRRVVNVVGGFNPHVNVVREINKQLKAHKAGPIVSRALRMRDVDNPDKMAAVAAEIVAEATA